MTDFETFCDRYGLDPGSQEARKQYHDAVERLKRLHAAAARAETQEAIAKAKSPDQREP